MEFKVIGFGACMISGYPYPEDAGLLRCALRKLQKYHDLSLHGETVTLGGFPAQRAKKHLRKKILDHHPDVVVLQFGSTDASAPLRRSGLIRLLAKKPANGDYVSSQPASWKHVLKWRLWGFAGSLLRVKPVTPMADYLAAMDKMVAECVASGSAVVVISPFVMGSGHSNRLARKYADALRKKIAGYANCHYLDAHQLLTPFPTAQILLRDGFHLSARGHELLGEKLAEILLQVATLTPSVPATDTRSSVGRFQSSPG